MMNKCTFRFYEELNFFLSKPLRKKSIEYQFLGNPSVKDAIESLGIPHTEVDLILVTEAGEKISRSVNFFYRLSPCDYFSVYPVFESMDISLQSKVRPKPLRQTRFILDVHLGKLAKSLRFLGFDTLYKNTFEDSLIIELALKEKRIILTRDRGILKQKRVTHGYYVKATHPQKQLAEVIKRFDLSRKVGELMQGNLTARCSLCNGEIRKIDDLEWANRSMYLEEFNGLNQVKEKTLGYYREFFLCTDCKKIYWKGSHYQNMKNMILGFSSCPVDGFK